MTQTYNTIDIEENSGPILNFLYKNSIGRMFLKLLIKPSFSRITGWFLDSRISVLLIKNFVKKNNIDLSEYVDKKYTSFNDFFKREITHKARNFPEESCDLFSPCDGKLSAYKLDEKKIFKIKNCEYKINDLIEDDELANEYEHGSMVILRLTPDDYHHYYFIDEGNILSTKKINGVLHTVRPIASEMDNVFVKNYRELTVMQTNNYDKVIQVEVGALVVGKIKNLKISGHFNRFEEKGYFEFGASTVILIFKENAVEVNEELIKNTNDKKETIVKLGQVIAKSSK